MNPIKLMADCPKSTVSLQPASQEQQAFLLAAYMSSRDDEMAAVTWDEPTKRAFLKMQFEAQQQHYQTNYTNTTREIVYLRDTPIGLIWVARWSGEIRLMDMVILREYRNHGIGSYLLQRLLTEAGQTDRMMTLHVWEGNPASIRFYLRHGFIKTTSDGMYAHMAWYPSSKINSSTPHSNANLITTTTPIVATTADH